MWKRQDKKYTKDRAKLTEDYIEFIERIDTFSLISNFYNVNNVKNYICKHKWTNKSLLTTHFSCILNTIHNHSDDVRDRAISVNLKQRLEFQEIIQKKDKALKNGAKPFKVSDLESLINSHNKNHNIYMCYCIIQLCTSIRYDNLNEIINPKACKVIYPNCLCKKNTTCNIIKETCFAKICFARSKTIAIDCYLIPTAIGCYNYIVKKNEKISYQKYSAWTKSIGYNTNSMRKFICNFSTLNTSRNVCWKSQSVMNKHYVGAHAKFSDIYNLMESLPSLLHK